MDLVRDLFVFSCYTGLSYIDVATLRHENIVLENEDELWISTERNKTMLPVKVPLLPKAASILEKYANDPRTSPKDLKTRYYEGVLIFMEDYHNEMVNIRRLRKSSMVRN